MIAITTNSSTRVKCLLIMLSPDVPQTVATLPPSPRLRRTSRACHPQRLRGGWYFSGAPLPEETIPDTVCRARLKRPCPTLRVGLVSKDHARHCVSCSSQKTMPDTVCRARLKRPCPTLRVVLVSGVPCSSAVLTPSREELLIFRWY